MQNLNFIESENKKNNLWQLDVNQYTDWAPEEVNNLLGYKPSASVRADIQRFRDPDEPSPARAPQ